MIYMYTVAMGAVLVCMVLTMTRAFLGPTVFDRILAINSFGTKTVIVIAVLGYLSERPTLYLDLAIVYALMNFIGTVAAMKFVRFGKLTGMDRTTQENKAIQEAAEASK